MANLEYVASKSQDGVPWWTSCRLTTSIISFFGGICYFGMRVNISVALVCMIGNPNNNNTVVDANMTTSSCGKTIDITNDDGDSLNLEGEFDWSRSDVGWVLSAFFWGYVFTQFPGGWLANRIGARLVMGGSMMAISVLTLMTPMASNISVYALMIVQGLKGLASGVYIPAYFQLWGRWAPPKERTFLVALASSGFQSGAMVGYSLSGYLCKNGFGGGWPSIFYVFGSGSLLWCVFWFAMVYSNPSEHPRISKAELEYMQESLPSTQAKNVAIPWKSLLTCRPIYAIFIANSCFGWSLYIGLSYIPMYLDDVFSIDIQSNGFYSALPGMCAVVVCLMSGIVSDFIISRKLLRRTYTRKLFQSLGFLPSMVISIVVGFLTCENQALAIILLTLWVGLMEFCSAGAMINIVDLAPRFAGLIMGIDNTISAFPGIIGPPIISVMTKNATAEEWQHVFLLCAGVFLIGWLSYIIMGSAVEQEWARDEDSPAKLDAEGTLLEPAVDSETKC